MQGSAGPDSSKHGAHTGICGNGLGLEVQSPFNTCSPVGQPCAHRSQHLPSGSSKHGEPPLLIPRSYHRKFSKDSVASPSPPRHIYCSLRPSHSPGSAPDLTALAPVASPLLPPHRPGRPISLLRGVDGAASRLEPVLPPGGDTEERTLFPQGHPPGACAPSGEPPPPQ